VNVIALTSDVELQELAEAISAVVWRATTPWNEATGHTIQMRSLIAAKAALAICSDWPSDTSEQPK
jgi:hypothetical protein